MEISDVLNFLLDKTQRTSSPDRRSVNDLFGKASTGAAAAAPTNRIVMHDCESIIEMRRAVEVYTRTTIVARDRCRVTLALSTGEYRSSRERDLMHSAFARTT